MATRIGIELSPTACRIVEIDAPPARWTEGAETRVRAFAALPSIGPATYAQLLSLKGRRASAVVWGVRNEQRLVQVARAPYDTMRAAALAAIRHELMDAGLDPRRLLSAIAPAGSAPAEPVQTVMLSAASADDVRSAIAPLVDVGVRVEAVLTPAAALLSLARTRRSSGTLGALDAYVALAETTTCVALVRDGVLVTAREFPWGFADPHVPGRARPRTDVAAALVAELQPLFTAQAASGGRVAQVCICGGLPELRSTTVPLIERLDVEVETLDSLFGIDALQLPDLSAEFRDRVAELRLAWAVAADAGAPLNLLRARRQRAMRRTLARAAVVAGAAAGLGAGFGIVRSAWWQSQPAPVARVPAPARTVIVPKPASTPAAAKPVSAPLPTVPKPAPAPVPLPASMSKAAPAPPSRSVAVQPAPARPAPPLRAAPSGPAVSRPIAPLVRPLPMTEPTEPSASGDRRIDIPAPKNPPAAKPSRTEALEPTRASAPTGRVAASVPRATRPEPDPTPFDAVLGTILYSPDRKLAIIDGRIVQPGDEIKGAHVVDITPTAVLLRDAQGRPRRLTLSSSGR